MCWMLPLHVAHTIALYTLRFDPSRDQPAMRTILISLATVPAWYALQALVVAASVNGIGAALWIMIVLFASVLDTCCRDGLKQGPRRARLVSSRQPRFRQVATVDARDAAGSDTARTRARGSADVDQGGSALIHLLPP